MRVTAPKDYKEDWDLYSRPVLQDRLTGQMERSEEYTHEQLLGGLDKL